MAKKEMESKSMDREEEKKDMKQDKAMADKEIKKAFKEHDSQEHKGAKGTKLELKKGGMPMKKMAKGGVTGQSMRAVGRNMARVANQGSKK